MNNAIKFTRKGTISITGDVRPLDDDPSQLVLTVKVSDEGIGMSDEEAAKVFDGMIENKNPLSK